MLWSLVVTVCLAADIDTRCAEMRWQPIATQAACERLLADERGRLDAAGMGVVMARCVAGWFA